MLPSGKLTSCSGKSLFLMGKSMLVTVSKSNINGNFKFSRGYDCVTSNVEITAWWFGASSLIFPYTGNNHHPN